VTSHVIPADSDSDSEASWKEASWKEAGIQDLLRVADALDSGFHRIAKHPVRSDGQNAIFLQLRTR
jgi:hypothetical protein